MQILLPPFKIAFELHQSPDNWLLKYASLPPKEKPSTPATYNSPKSFLQLNVKTKITTPLRRKKEKRLGNWEDHVFMSTFRKMEKETRWQNKHWWRSNYFVTSFYVFHIFHSMLNVPILHGVACVKSRTPKEQSTTEAEHYVEFCSSSVSLRRKKKNFKHIYFPSSI